MTFYSNVLPIHFGGRGIHVIDIGKPETGNLAGLFEHGGGRYAFAGSPAAQIGGESIAIDPIDIPEVMLPMLRERLADTLLQHGKVETAGDLLHFQPNGPQAGCMLMLYLDLNARDSKSSRYCVVVTPASQADDSYLLALDSISPLIGSDLLGDGMGCVGTFEVLPHPPLTKRSLIFSIDGTQHAYDAQVGLSKFGPYSKDQTRRRRLQVAYLCPKADESKIGHFLRDLKEGIKYPHQAGEVWGRPWSSVFCFKEAVFTAIDPDQEDFLTSLNNLFERKKAEGTAVDVLLYFGGAEQPALEAAVLDRGIPVHHMPATVLDLFEVPRAECLLDTALALYAKCKGQPWLLTQDPTLAHEVVVGIGSHTLEGGKLGYATVFSSQGNYRLGEARWMPDGSDWVDFFANILTNKLAALERQAPWTQYSEVNLMLHLDARADEAQLAQLKARLVDYAGDRTALKVSFLYMTQAHPFRFWPVLAKFAGQSTIAERGRYLAVGHRKMLLQLATEADADRRPQLLELLQPSDNLDLSFQVNQVFYFSLMSWLSIKPAHLPVTLLYSQRVAAKYAAFLSSHPRLHLPDTLQDIPWYL